MASMQVCLSETVPRIERLVEKTKLIDLIKIEG